MNQDWCHLKTVDIVYQKKQKINKKIASPTIGGGGEGAIPPIWNSEWTALPRP